MNTCVDLPRWADGRKIERIKQEPNALCAYYSEAEDGCHGARHYIDTHVGSFTEYPTSWPWKPSRVKCVENNPTAVLGQGDWSSDRFSQWFDNEVASTSASTPGHIPPTVERQEARALDDLSARSEVAPMAVPGDVTVCSEEDYLGECESFNAMKRCVALPQSSTWRQVRSIVQAKGAFCGYCE